jgi:hypothetical protein
MPLLPIVSLFLTSSANGYVNLGYMLITTTTRCLTVLLTICSAWFSNVDYLAGGGGGAGAKTLGRKDATKQATEPRMAVNEGVYAHLYDLSHFLSSFFEIIRVINSRKILTLLSIYLSIYLSISLSIYLAL